MNKRPSKEDLAGLSGDMFNDALVATVCFLGGCAVVVGAVAIWRYFV